MFFSRLVFFSRLSMAALATAPLVLLPACSTKTKTQLQTDVLLISSGVGAIVASLAAVPNVPPDVITKAQALIAQVQANATTIAGALTPNPDVVQAIATDLQMLVPLLTPYYPAAPALAAVLQAALALVPIIMASVNVSAAQVGKPAVSPDVARATLRMVAK